MGVVQLCAIETGCRNRFLGLRSSYLDSKH
jgi:hypothetical protein